MKKQKSGPLFELTHFLFTGKAPLWNPVKGIEYRAIFNYSAKLYTTVQTGATGLFVILQEEETNKLWISTILNSVLVMHCNFPAYPWGQVRQHLEDTHMRDATVQQVSSGVHLCRNTIVLLSFWFVI